MTRITITYRTGDTVKFDVPHISDENPVVKFNGPRISIDYPGLSVQLCGICNVTNVTVEKIKEKN